MNTNKKTLEDAIKHVVNYYAYFKYAPSFDELFTYLPIKTSKKELQITLRSMAERKIIENWSASRRIKIKNSLAYTLPPYRIYATQKGSKKMASEHKMASISLYLRVVYLIAPIKLIGLSGSIAMLDADVRDDIDLFIIAQRSRMWTVRLWCLLFASLFGLRRRRGVKNAPNKVCLNLFFDEREVIVPKQKQNEYTAHEVLQMKPMFVKGDTYKRFLRENSWVMEYFPNATFVILNPFDRLRTGSVKDLGRKAVTNNASLDLSDLPRNDKIGIGNIVEAVVKKIQLWIIKRHQTTEIISDTQLWFFPRDFEKRLKTKGII